MEPRIAEAGVRTAVYRDLNLHSIVGGGQHQGLTLQLYRLAVFLERTRFPEDCVVASEVTTDRSFSFQRDSKKSGFRTSDAFFLLVVARDRVGLERTLGSFAGGVAIEGAALWILLVCLRARNFAGGSKRRIRD